MDIAGLTVTGEQLVNFFVNFQLTGGVMANIAACLVGIGINVYRVMYKKRVSFKRYWCTKVKHSIAALGAVFIGFVELSIHNAPLIAFFALSFICDMLINRVQDTMDPPKVPKIPKR